MATEVDKEQVVTQLSRIKNVGEHRAALMYEQLEVRSIEELVSLARQGELVNLSGIGKATQEKILTAALEALDAEQADDASEDERDEIEEAADEVVEDIASAAEPEVIVVDEPAAPASTAKVDASPSPLERFLSVLVCPNCGNESFDAYGASLTCTACRREYGFENGVADLAPPYRKTSNASQRLMETRFYSKFYEDFMRPRLTSIVTERSLREEYALSTELLELEATSRVLDVACGTGNFTRYFAQRLDALGGSDGDNASLLVGIDLSWPMLENARAYIRRDQLEDDLFLVRGDATRLPLRRASFDRIHCAGALHMMDDIDEALRNFACVLETGGVCVIGTFTLGDGIVRKIAKRLAEIPSKFHWFSQKELYQRMERAGFEIIEESVAGDAITVKARKC